MNEVPVVTPLADVPLPISPSMVADDDEISGLRGDDAASGSEVPSMQHQFSNDPVEVAYARAALGFSRALEVSGLPAAERARLVRCWRHAVRKSGRQSLAPVPEPLRDRQAG